MFLPLPVIHDLPTPANREFKQALKRLDDVMTTIGAAYRRTAPTVTTSCRSCCPNATRTALGSATSRSATS